MIERVVSGGQTGVDQAALRMAKSFGIPTGGWMPLGFLTEDGPRPEFARIWGMKDHDSPEYPPRTRANVYDSDFTLILGKGAGSNLTYKMVVESGKPFVCYPDPFDPTIDWGRVARKISGSAVLNVAGSRGSKMRRIEVGVIEKILERIFVHLTAAGHHLIPDLLFADPEGNYEAGVGDRVGGSSICPYCRREYFDHPLDQTRLGYHDQPFLHVLCDGRVVKL